MSSVVLEEGGLDIRRGEGEFIVWSSIFYWHPIERLRLLILPVTTRIATFTVFKSRLQDTDLGIYIFFINHLEGCEIDIGEEFLPTTSATSPLSIAIVEDSPVWCDLVEPSDIFSDREFLTAIDSGDIVRIEDFPIFRDEVNTDGVSEIET